MFYRLSPSLVLRSHGSPYWPRPEERVLSLRAAAVFPPGHATTRLCLELLKETMTAGAPASLLDVGCGSGVLLLAGAALGAPFCLGADLSRAATRTSWENARQNGLGGAVQVVQGSTECLKGAFELILANLPFTVQMDKVTEFSRLLAPDGALILSGFKDTQEAELWPLYAARGWSLKRRLLKDEWVAELPPEKSYTWVAWLLNRQVQENPGDNFSGRSIYISPDL